MSTKIYNAYRINEDVPIEQVMQLLLQAKEEFHGVIVNFLSKDEVCTLARLEAKTFFSVSEKLKEIIRKGCNDTFNFESSIMVYFFEGRIYLQFYGLDRPLRNDIVERLFGPVSVDYHYQDQADPWYDYDDSLTDEEKLVHEKEYDERERVWKGILGDRYRAAESGLVFEVFTKDDCIHVAMAAHEKLREKEDE